MIMEKIRKIVRDIIYEFAEKNDDAKSLKDIAKEFYSHIKTKYPGSPLGKSGSGNCAWTANAFFNWASKKYPGHTKVLLFIENKREDQAHIVPVFDNNIIDYIQEFTGGKPFMIHPLTNNKVGKIQEIEMAGLNHYKKWYDLYVLEKDKNGLESNQELKKYYNDYYSSTDDFKITTLNAPKINRDELRKQISKNRMDESIDYDAGVWVTDEHFDDGDEFKIKFKVRDIIELSKNYPAKNIDPKSMEHVLKGRQEDWDEDETEKRVENADLSYPIIVVSNKSGKNFAMLDGTHRLEKALGLGLDKIKGISIPINDLKDFKVDDIY